MSDTATLTEHETQQIERANATGLTPVVFIHGLWLLPSSWDRWATVFEEAGFTALTPGWPDDPETVEEAKRTPRRSPARASRRSPTTTPPPSGSSRGSRP